MPQGSAGYLYTITLDASSALASAKTFTAALKQELAGVNMSQALGTGDLQKQLQAIRASAGKAGAALHNAAMQGQGGFRQTYNQMNLLQTRVKDFQETVRRLGIQPQEWIDASQVNRYAMALQAAQRRVWGIRGMGAQAQMYGREMMGVGLGVLGGAGMAAREYAQFAEPMGRAARNLELNAEMTEELDSKLRSLAGTASVFDPTEQAEGLYLWAAATGEVVDSSAEMDQLLGRVGEVQKLASLGMVSYGQAVEAVTDVQSQFQLGVEDTSNIVATIVKVAATSKAEVGDLAEAFKYAGTYAHQTNTSFEETAAILQLLSAYGLRGSMAGRGLARMLENLIAPSKAAKEELDALFETAFGRTDVLVTAEGNFVGTANAVRILAEATENLTQAERAEFVARITTQNASRILLPLLNAELEARKRGISALEENEKIITDQADAHTVAYQKMMKDIYGYEVSLKSAADTMEFQWSNFLDSTDGRVKMTQAAFQGAMTTIGRSVMQTALPAIEALAKQLQTVAAYAEAHPGTVSGILQTAAVTVAIGLLLSALGKGVTLYADYKALAMAATFKRAVDKFGAEVALFYQAQAMRPTPAFTGGLAAPSGTVARGAAPLTGAAAAPAAAGAASLGGFLAASTIGTAMLGAVLAASNYVAKLETGRGLLDLMETKTEAMAAYMEATALAAERLQALGVEGGQGVDWLEGEVSRAEEDLAKWKEWMRLSTEYVPETLAERAEIYERLEREVPRQYQHKRGGIDVDLLREGYAEAEARVNALKDALSVARGVQIEMTQDVELYSRYVTEAAEATNYALGYALSKEAMDNIMGRGPAAGPAAGTGQQWGEALPREITSSVQAWAEATAAAGDVDIITSAQLADLTAFADALGVDIEKLGIFTSSMGDLTAVIQGFTGGTIQSATNLLRAFAGEIPSTEELAIGMAGNAQGTWGRMSGLVGAGVSSGQINTMWGEYLSGLEMVYAEAENMDRYQGELLVAHYQEAWSQIVTTAENAQEEMTKAAEQAAKDQKKAYEDAAKGLRGIVEKALEPTEVTAQDMADTRAGIYEEKWDEAARQMRAAMAGSARWKEMIPDEVWMQGADAARDYGKRWIDEFYAGAHPEAIRWEPLLDSIEQALAQAAGEQNLVDMTIQKLAEERGITATSEQVMSALAQAGLISPATAIGGVMGQMDLAGAGEQAFKDAMEYAMPAIETALKESDMSGPSDALAQGLSGGFAEKIKSADWGTMIQSEMKSDISGSKEKFTGLGEDIGGFMWNGIVDTFEGSKFFWAVVEATVRALNSAAAQIEGVETEKQAGAP